MNTRAFRRISASDFCRNSSLCCAIRALVKSLFMSFVCTSCCTLSIRVPMSRTVVIPHIQFDISLANDLNAFAKSRSNSKEEGNSFNSAYTMRVYLLSKMLCTAVMGARNASALASVGRFTSLLLCSACNTSFRALVRDVNIALRIHFLNSSTLLQASRSCQRV